MAKEKNSFVLYYDLEGILYDLNDHQAAELFRAIFAYEKRGEAYSGADPEVKIAMRFVSRALDDNDERYRAKVEKRREAGRKGGLKSAEKRKQTKQSQANQANATKRKQSQANQADNDPDPVPDNDPDSEGATLPTRARVTRRSELASQKVQWADNVTMTNAEHQKLLDAYGPADTALMIEHLSHYKAAHQKRYDSDYRAILSWVTQWLSERKGMKRRTDAAQRPSKAPAPMPQTQESLAEQEQRILENERWMREFLNGQQGEKQSEQVSKPEDRNGVRRV